MNFGHKSDGLATLLAVTQNTCQRQKRSHISAQNMLRCFLFCMVVSFRSYSQNVAFPKQIKKKKKRQAQQTLIYSYEAHFPWEHPFSTQPERVSMKIHRRLFRSLLVSKQVQRTKRKSSLNQEKVRGQSMNSTRGSH